MSVTTDNEAFIYEFHVAFPGVIGYCGECGSNIKPTDCNTGDLPEGHKGKNLRREDGSFFNIVFVRRKFKDSILIETDVICKKCFEGFEKHGSYS